MVFDCLTARLTKYPTLRIFIKRHFFLIYGVNRLLRVMIYPVVIVTRSFYQFKNGRGVVNGVSAYVTKITGTV